MSLTLALGLKYDPPQRTEFLPIRQEGISDDLKQGTTTSTTRLKDSPVIDIKAIERDAPSAIQTDHQQYHYLSYNMHATLNILHAIGTQLHITI